MAESSSSSAPQGAATSLLNGLGVLEAFSVNHPILGVTEISERVGLHKSTVSRMLNGLSEAGYVERDDASNRYRLGLRALRLSAPLLANLDLRRGALPFLEELTEELEETTSANLWNGYEVIAIEQVDSPHQVKHSAAIGTRYPLWASSSVRVCLAELEFSEVQELIESGKIIVRKADMNHEYYDDMGAHLEQVREDGIAVNDGLTVFEEFGASAPVRDFRGKLVGCITCSAPRQRVQHEHKEESIMQGLKHAGKRISERLGYPG